MPKYLDPKYGVAISGQKWTSGNFTLWQSGRDDVILVSPNQPVLAKGEAGRYQASVTQYRAQREGTYKTIGGAAVVVLQMGIDFELQELERLKEEWRAQVVGSGRAKTDNPQFVGLNTRKGQALFQIPDIAGRADPEHNRLDIGTPGGPVSFLVELTPEGAQEWVQAIKEGKNVTAGVVIEYEYLRLIPTSTIHVRVNGQRVFRHLSTHLKASARRWFYGGSLDIQTQWESMVRTGAVEVEVNGLEALPAGTEEIKQNITNTFINQALQHLFDSLFEPKPDVEPAEAGATRGFFGGANFALKWRKESEATNLSLDMEFNGWSWLKSRMDANVTTYFAQLDDTYVNEVNTEMATPAALTVDGDPLVTSTGVAWSASEGKAPEAPVFGPAGGTKTYIITSRDPQDVEVSWRAKVNFADAAWPIIEKSGKQTIREGGNQVVVKPSADVARKTFYMFVREDGSIKFFDIENDYVVLNVSVRGPHLPRSLSASTRLTPLEPVELSYPLDPAGDTVQAEFSAFGVVGGRLVRAPTTPLNLGEQAVAILATQEGLQLVSQNSIIPEADKLAHDLLRAQAQPIVRKRVGRPGEPISEAGYEPDATLTADGMVSGTVVAVEYSIHGPALVIETDTGERRRVRLKRAEYADRFDDERKRVRVRMAGEYAEDILVEL